jgi:hypothetical protein
MKHGFNWGQLHHALHMEYQLNGYAPQEFIQWIKDNFPHEMLMNVRFSGTMSNTMMLDTPGYGHLQHDLQLQNRRIAQPTISYLAPFVDLYRQLGCKDLSFTINTHRPFASGSKQDLEQMMKAFRFVYTFCNVTAIELENETYFYHSITGASAGQPNALDRIALAGGFFAAFNNRNVEEGMARKINAYLDFLEFTVVPLLKEYNLPIGISVGNPTNMRERIWNREVLKRNFYTFLIPHIYLTVESFNDIKNEVKRQLDAIRKPGKAIHITEYNWNYQAAPEGPGSETNFRLNFTRALQDLKVDAAYFHCLSQSNSAYSFVKRP